ncbi:hypothetical protein SGRA_2717 [Saprospira grandis str. Lewin]|uniref:Uncharacterized protein n=1 Tax=Saprospira grandis (strain Lewin) TaxID=984262 RepID=H6L9G9_SAPGL|nr:hypothetical protein SGRA_2717 [Saprospira grandis str. Lewin]
MFFGTPFLGAIKWAFGAFSGQYFFWRGQAAEPPQAEGL